MKTKKHSVLISSILAEFILQNRITGNDHWPKKLNTIQQRLNSMHRDNHYSRQLCLDLIEKPQYNIQHKLTLKQNRINKNLSLAIHFKLTEKRNSHVTYLESWLLSMQRHSLNLKQHQINFNQQLAYLIEQLIRAIKYQFLTDFQTMGQQFKSKYIMDYEIELNPNKKNLKKLSPLHYQRMWNKQALIDQQNIIFVSCYHNTNKKLQSIITQERQWSRQRLHKNLKHGSQETKPSNSGEYELSTSIEEKNSERQRGRKTSIIEYYDQDLNITVLSNDSESFKKSTGRIQGVYTGPDPQHNEPQYDSDDQFQILIEEESFQEEKNKSKRQEDHPKIRQVQKEIEGLLLKLDQTLEECLN